jgi:hypothetical protein
MNIEIMKLNDFIFVHDFVGSVVLLEGKRDVNENDKEKLIALGKLLCLKTKEIIFRSGNAEGADYYFAKGVTEVNKNRMEVITPYSKHRQKYNDASITYSLDDIDIAAEPEVVYESKQNKKTEKLIDKYVLGARDPFSLKAAYIIRDTIKVLGTEKIKPATFGIFYDDLNNPMQGGTGHTMNVCIKHKIPLINQEIWLKWLEKEN